uniref:Bet v I/Major latex protein domain-containing protein n=1 Tax=Kalanchoe fedtschenkoi TaxID=63787 RepID=A0A7N0T1W8_KALFE
MFLNFDENNVMKTVTMVATTFTDEYSSTVSPARLFRALILESHILIPKLIPQAVKSIEIQGDGGAGSIKVINFAAGSQLQYVKYRIDEINPETFTYSYTLVEGHGLSDKLESVVYKVQFEVSADGGTVSKMTSTYTTLGGHTLDEEQVKIGKEKALGMYKVVEAYLLQNPDVYA